MKINIRSLTTFIFSFLLAAISSQALAVTPKAGIWWNPSENGRGYSIDVSGNALVMAVYAYNTNGSAQWYIASGTLTNNGTQWQGTLGKYANGPCMGCLFSSSQEMGNDGTISIRFDSDTSGVMTMPNGATTNIQTFFAPISDNIADGLPVTFKGFTLEKIERTQDSTTCKIKLTAKNNNDIPKTAVFYFNVLQNNAVIYQTALIFEGLGAGQIGTQEAFIFVSNGDCNSFNLQFNSANSFTN